MKSLILIASLSLTSCAVQNWTQTQQPKTVKKESQVDLAGLLTFVGATAILFTIKFKTK